MAGHEIEKGEVGVYNESPIQRDTPTKEEEKDCTDQLIECTVQCDTNDSECREECVEEYKECELPWEEELDGGNIQMLDHDNEIDKGELISEILQIAALLNGTCERSETSDSRGRSSKKITIEYDVQFRDQGTSEEA